MGEFNPGFSFDIGEHQAEIQAPWDFSGALKDAEKAGGTSIDYKIQKQISISLKKKQQGRGQGRQQQRAKVHVDADSDASEEEEEDSDLDSEEENLLPGEEELSTSEDDDEELDDVGSDDDEEEENDSESEEIMSEEEEEEEEAKRGNGKKRARLEESRPTITKSNAKSTKPIQQSDSDDDDSNNENDSESEGEAQATAKNNKRLRGAAAAPASTANGKSKKGYFDAAPEGTTFAATSFADLNLSRPLVRACAALGYTRPTPIQAACIPLALTGRDICGSAITGSGKTAAFSLPLLERLLHRNKRVAATYVLVLAPTRELAVQVHSMMSKLAQFTDIRAALVVGGLSLQAQAAALRESPEIVVATPGRLIDHLRNSQGFGLEELAALILDEADRLLEMGFKEEVREIVRMAPIKRQTMLFSATMTEEVQSLVTLSLRHPVRLAADAAAASPDALTQEVVRLKGGAAAHKEATLLALVSRTLASCGRTIIFFSTKQKAHRCKILFGLAKMPPAAELHGDMTQAARLESLEKFRKGEAAFLLATDVAARGLDILGVETVVNFDCPRGLASYLHRVGRTARAGARGRSITFAEDGDRALLKEVVKKGRVDLQQRKVPPQTVAAWQTKVERLGRDIIDVMVQEREEKEMRKAEMEASKAANMIEHEAEIYARPPRTWFQTSKEKQETADRAKTAAMGVPESIQKKIDKNTAKSARRMDRKISAAEAEKAQAKQRGKNTLMDETADVTRRIRAVKAREHELKLEGLSGSRAGKIAAAMMSGVKKKKKKRPAQGTEGGEGGLFAGDGIGKPEKRSSSGGTVYAGGARSGKPRPPANGTLTGTALNKAKRGGKGKNTFKSKARHKRR